MGGASRRMGQAKALLRLPSQKLLVELALEALQAAGASHLLLSGTLSWRGRGEVERVPDASPGLGPLAGLEGVLRASQTPWCLVVACDMPSLDSSLLQEVIGARRPAAEAVVPWVEGRPQPLHAAYHKRCLPKAQEALKARRLSLKAFLKALETFPLPCPPGSSFQNLNTKAALEAYLRSESSGSAGA